VKRLFQAVLFVAVLYTVAQSRRDLIVLLSGFVAASVIWSVYALGSGTAVAGTRLTGGLNDPNYLAAELVLAIVLSAYLLGTASLLRVRLLLVAAVTIDLVTFLLTQSRGGIIGLSVGVLAAIAVAGKTRVIVVAVAALSVSATIGYIGIIAPAHLRNRVTDFSTSHTSGRSDSWQIAWKITQDHPVKGVGLGGFRDEQLKYTSAVDVQFIGQVLNDRLVVHNTYLETLTELGSVGFVLFGGSLLIALAGATRALRRVSPADANAVRGLVAGTLGMLAAFFFVSAEYEKPLWIAVALLAASSTTLARDPARAGGAARETLQPTPAAGRAATGRDVEPRF
jgi:O-antigen ligase